MIPKGQIPQKETSLMRPNGHSVSFYEGGVEVASDEVGGFDDLEYEVSVGFDAVYD